MQPVDAHVPAFVTLQARKAPNSLAVVDDACALTYGELEARANALSTYLRSLGLVSDAIVGICLGRSLAQVVGALAVMKSGAAYLPLDPAQPPDRLLVALRDAGAAIVLTAGTPDTVASSGPWRSVQLRTDGSFESAPAAASEAAHLQSADLAYVIYTSGSTGEPKGVEITHGGLANLIAWHRATFAIQAADRASHISAVGFDAAVWEVWPYLCAGASVHIARDETAREPRALADWIVANAITVAFVSTPMAERLIDLDYPAHTALRIMLTGADTLHRYPPASLPFALYNNYGPTEATVVATSGKVEASADDGTLPSIGRPIDNTDIYILGDNGSGEDAGVEGEICIAGRGLARGYRGRPDLTAEKFQWIAPAGQPPVRVYRSGDRGRRLSDGRIAFLGRIDDQVKIRGFRVEPREIEVALNAHTGVIASAVVASEFAPGDERLVAYLVTASDVSPALGELQTFLAARLPVYMIPSTFIKLPMLPLTQNGKVDRAQLRARETGVSLVPEDYVAPRTITEGRLVQIVAALLKLDRVGVDADFFMLGGHSLLGTQLIARLRDTFGVQIGLRFLFESPTIAALATEVDRLVQTQLEAVGDGQRSLESGAEHGTARIAKRRA